MHDRRLDADSHGFAWQDHEEAGSFLTDAQVAGFDAEGFCLIEGALTAEFLRSLEGEIDLLEEERNQWLRQQPQRRSWISRADVVDFAPHLVARSRTLRELSRSRPLTGICCDLVGPDVRLYFDQAVYKHQGSSSATLPWHQDNGYNFKRPEAYITVWIPFHDVGPDNGCLWVVPGLHRLGTLQHGMNDDGFLVCDVDSNDAVPVPVRRGDIVALSSLAPHASAGNRSQSTRKAYLLSYVTDGTCLRDGSPCDAPDTQYRVLQGGVTPRE